MEVLYFLLDFFAQYGYWAVFLVLIACGFGLPIPEDVTLVAGGVICALSKETTHLLNQHLMAAVALSGVLGGDGIMFISGRLLGSKVTRIPIIRRVITVDTYNKIQDKAHKYGNKILFIARFLPGLRAPVFLTAGVSHRVPMWKFLLMDGFAALISVPLLVYLGYFFANDLERVLSWIKHSEFLIGLIIATVILSVVIYKRIKK